MSVLCWVQIPKTQLDILEPLVHLHDNGNIEQLPQCISVFNHQLPRLAYRLPFPPFFFPFPPWVCCCCCCFGSSTAGASTISTSTGAGADRPNPATSAPAANFPRLVINRLTSCALFVRYCKQIPVAGLNVFSVRVAIGALGVLSDFLACDFWIRLTLPGLVVGKLYFVTMRVCSC